MPCFCLPTACVEPTGGELPPLAFIVEEIEAKKAKVVGGRETLLTGRGQSLTMVSQGGWPAAAQDRSIVLRYPKNGMILAWQLVNDKNIAKQQSGPGWLAAAQIIIWMIWADRQTQIIVRLLPGSPGWPAAAEAKMEH